MSKMKELDRTQYGSDYDAIVSIIQEGHLDNYDFNVCSADAITEALAYLCINDIPHHYHIVHSLGLSLVTITLGANDDFTYCCWSEYKEIEDSEM